tara:strand:- start:58 stop:726 length:669 start_codon:yes stop_codon:yes gene_type:complete
MTDIVPLDLALACRKNNVIDESIRKSIEESFKDTMVMMQRNKHSFSKIMLQEADDMNLQNPFASTEDKMETEYTDVRSYSKVYDDSRMRPAVTGEAQCVSGNNCECNIMAIDSGIPECGFTGVVYNSRYQKCILCIRVDTMMEFYTRLISGSRTSENILPFTNLVDRIGEYNKEMCIHPNGRNNISGPFVIHQRQNYQYTNGIIEQLPNVNFCTVRSLDDNG